MNQIIIKYLLKSLLNIKFINREFNCLLFNEQFYIDQLLCFYYINNSINIHTQGLLLNDRIYCGYYPKEISYQFHIRLRYCEIFIINNHTHKHKTTIKIEYIDDYLDELYFIVLKNINQNNFIK